MGKRKKEAAAAHTVVRGPGPLGPWKLSIAVGVAAVTTGMQLFDAAKTGEHLDLALGKSFGAALVAWIAASWINRVLIDAEVRSETADALAQAYPESRSDLADQLGDNDILPS